MAPVKGIKIGVRVVKGKEDSEDVVHDTGFIDPEAHQSFIENTFFSSPYNNISKRSVEEETVS